MSDTFRESGFFCLRSPLLPFDEFLRWGRGLGAAAAVDNAGELKAVLEVDRARLRAFLQHAFAAPHVAEALLVGSPSLHDSLDVWVAEPESDRGQRIERGLVRYFSRMTGRATPFGLFGGCSFGRIRPDTRLALERRHLYRRQTRLDMERVQHLANVLSRDPRLQRHLRYRSNPTLYRAAGRLRYVETRMQGTSCSHHLVAVDRTEYLEATLDRAREGARLEELAAALCGDDITLGEAEDFVRELIDSQVLVSDLYLPLTGADPVDALLSGLSAHPFADDVVVPLRKVQTGLRDIDRTGCGAQSKQYRAVLDELGRLPGASDPSHSIQVDLLKPADNAALGRPVVDALLEGVEALYRLARSDSPDPLAAFRTAFLERYGEREVPLVEALDEESGIGLGLPASATLADAPLLRGLPLPVESDAVERWTDRERWLLERLSAVTTEGGREITLSQADVEQLSARDGPPLPDAFAAFGAIAAASDAAVAEGRFQLFLHSVVGPSGARLLGRFCALDDTFRRLVEEHLRLEEALDPDALFAELVHLPEGRAGNVLLRPCLRAYEIPYVGHSGAPVERQIPVSDLRVSVVKGHVVLRSERLDRRIVPRLTSAHAYLRQGLPVYQFLCALQGEGVATSVAWSWGPLGRAPFLPRVRIGRVVLSRASWTVSRPEIESLGQQDVTAGFAAVHRWRTSRKLPRLALLCDRDHELTIDFENVLSVESFRQALRRQASAVVTEMFPGPDELCLRGPEGRFVHELLVPFVGGHAPASQPRSSRSDTRFPAVRRTYSPLSDWTFVKVYAGPATVDLVLREVIKPVAEWAVQSGTAERWHFLRFADPHWHLRVRFQSDDQAGRTELLSRLTTSLEPRLNDGSVWRVQLDTYEREIERYGGAQGIVLAEEVFHHDSEAALAIVDACTGDAGLERRGRLAIYGIDRLLDDFDLDLDRKRLVVSQARDALARELRLGPGARHRLGLRYREERSALETVFEDGREGGGDMATGLAALRARSLRLQPALLALKAAENAGGLSVPCSVLAASYVHLHVNRMLRSAHRLQELVLYDFLDRLYQSWISRGSQPKAPAGRETAAEPVSRPT